MSASPISHVNADLERVQRDELREQVRKDTIASWEHYKATGLHLTHEEVGQWFDRLEAGEDVDPPECHV